MVAKVGRRNRHIGPELPLNRDVPAVIARRLDVVRHGDEQRVKRRRPRVGGRGDRVRIGPADRAPRVVEQRASQPLLEAERRRRARIEEELAGHEVSGHAVADAHRCAAVAARVPRQPQARRDVGPDCFHAGRARKARVAGIVQTDWRLRIYRAVRIRTYASHVEAVERLVLAVLRKPRLPPGAVVERNFRRQPPRVLPVEGHVRLGDVLAERRRFAEFEHAAEQEVSKRKARDGAVERNRTHRADVRLGLPVGQRHRTTDAVLMVAAHLCEIVRERQGVRLIEGERFGAGIDRKRTRGRDVHVMRHVAVHLHAHVFGTEHVGVRPNDAGTIHRDAHVVDHRVAHHPRLADGQRVRRDVAATGAALTGGTRRGQDVAAGIGECRIPERRRQLIPREQLVGRVHLPVHPADRLFLARLGRL